MIFVSVGTQKFQFNRLIKAIDNLALSGELSDRIIAQIGYCNYSPKSIEFYSFLSPEDFERNINMCDIVVTHSGVGTIVKGLKAGKPVIVVPRLAKYGEHVDDHQIEIADAFTDKNYVLKCNDVNKLPAILKEAKVHTFQRYVSQQSKAIDVVRDFLDSCEQEAH